MSTSSLSNRTHNVGLIFGKFFPLHRGHIYLIEQSLTYVDELHVMIGCETSRDKHLFEQSHLSRLPTRDDRLSWLKTAFNGRTNIHFYVLDEDGIPLYPNGWEAWSNQVKNILAEKNIIPNLIFTSEPQDETQHKHYFKCNVQLIDVSRIFMPISATQIRQDPINNWHFLTKTTQSFFSLNVVTVAKQPYHLPIIEQIANIYQVDIITHEPKMNENQYAPFRLYLAKNEIDAEKWVNHFYKTKQHYRKWDLTQKDKLSLNTAIKLLNDCINIRL